MLKYKLVDGELVESEDGTYLHTSDIQALSIALGRLKDRIKDYSVMYPVTAYNSEIFQDIFLLIEDVNGQL